MPMFIGLSPNLRSHPCALTRAMHTLLRSTQARCAAFGAIGQMLLFAAHFQRKVSDVFTLQHLGAGSRENRPSASVFLDFLG